MANPGHALAASNAADIAVLRTEIAVMRSHNEVNWSRLEAGIRELLELLQRKNVITEDEKNILETQFVFIRPGGVW